MRICQNLSPRLCLLALGTALAGGCQAADQGAMAGSSLADVRSRGVLRVATLNAPTTWYLGTHGPEGLEYELARDFARKLGVKLDMNAVSDVSALRRALQSGSVDLVAAQITPDETWKAAGLASSPYDEIAQQWVYRRGRPKPRSLTEVAAARIVVGQDSPEARSNGSKSRAALK
jgi:membrane-bound lytic murein transglycosylase F